jgi:hypothetical protein
MFIARSPLWFSQLRQKRHGEQTVHPLLTKLKEFKRKIFSIQISLLAELVNLCCSVTPGEIGPFVKRCII